MWKDGNFQQISLNRIGDSYSVQKRWSERVSKKEGDEKATHTEA